MSWFRKQTLLQGRQEVMLKLSEHDKAVLNCVFNPNLPLNEVYDEELPDSVVDVEDDTEEGVYTRKLELEAVTKAESGHMQSAMELLNSAIKITPNRPSLYNNRAQLHRLLGSDSDAMNDLTKAIDLSKNYQRTLCQALCQRGLLFRKNGEGVKATDDFNAAAKLGSQFAKNQLIQLNPYAALCNQMLRQVFEELK